MATKTRRIEARVDPIDDEAITVAAKMSGMSVSAFLVSAARHEADRVIGRADTTLMSPELFDAVLSSLDAPDDLPALAALATDKRAYQRR